ncbi:YkuS family protein [Alteribacillus iranensis]|uniref:Gas vesicle protein n=1 Tax=Alteribacillus iranensis TaxID=930128 RepID=A0A1I2BU18_9BACI|nr:YkuS family protein [Alteribacillus iranensis]SFE59537.1 Gas vesicle protein [Alteribacillus iranensis]
MARIAIEQPFTDVRDELSRIGFEAEMLLNKTDAPDYDCVVVRGIEDLTDMRMNTPLVEAKGRTVHDIIEEVKDKLERTGEIREAPPSGKVSKIAKFASSGSSKTGESSGKSMVSGMLVGTALGVVTGFLLAPKSGKELRQQMNEKAGQTKEQATVMTNKVRERSAATTSNVMNMTNKAKETVKNRPSLTGRTRGVQEEPSVIKEPNERSNPKPTEEQEEEVNQ